MPGLSGLAAKAHLGKTWDWSPGRIDGVLLIGLTQEPPKRLGSEPEAKAFLDAAAQAYAQQAGITLSSGGGGGRRGGGSTVGVMIDSEQLDKLQAKQDEFVSQQVEVLMRYLGRDSRTGHRLADSHKAEVALLQDKLDAINREHGDAYVQGIQPVFDPLKARHFNSSWNWVRQDALTMWMDRVRRVDPHRRRCRRGRRCRARPDRQVAGLRGPRRRGALEPILCLVSGPNRVDVARLAAVTGEPRHPRATAREAQRADRVHDRRDPAVRPLRPVRAIMDPDLGRFQTVWAAAGTSTAVFPVAARRRSGSSPTRPSRRSPRTAAPPTRGRGARERDGPASGRHGRRRDASNAGA